MARISIVIPFFNSHATLGETLESLSAQSFRDFEIILVDDGSTATEAQACLAALPATHPPLVDSHAEAVARCRAGPVRLYHPRQGQQERTPGIGVRPCRERV